MTLLLGQQPHFLRSVERNLPRTLEEILIWHVIGLPCSTSLLQYNKHNRSAGRDYAATQSVGRLASTRQYDALRLTHAHRKPDQTDATTPSRQTTVSGVGVSPDRDCVYNLPTSLYMPHTQYVITCFSSLSVRSGAPSMEGSSAARQGSIRHTGK